MGHAKSECEELLNVLLPFAEELLAKHGEFFPFAATMNNLGGIAHVAGYTGSEQPPSADVIALLKGAFREGARTSEYRATALAYDVRVQSPTNNAKCDAVAVELDHADEYSVVVYFPYTVNENRVEVGVPFAQEGSDEVFGQQPEEGGA